MQVEPQQQQAVLLTPTNGSGLSLDAGKQVVARVLDVDANGSARISLAGQAISVQSTIPLRAGDTLQLTVGTSSSGGVQFSMTGSYGSGGAASAATIGAAGPTPPAAASAAVPAAVVASELQAGPAVVRELARAGVAVTPQLARGVAEIVAKLAQGDGTRVDAAARAVANLVGRGLDISPAAVGRVAAALDQAGQFGARVAELAKVAPSVAAALPTSAPSGDAVRGLMTPGLSSAETAIARIVQATANAAGGSANASTIAASAPKSASSTVIQNYVASQVAATTQLEALASSGIASSGSGTAAAAPSAAAAAATASALRGDANMLAAAKTGAAAPTISAPLLTAGTGTAAVAGQSVPAQPTAPQAAQQAAARGQMAAATGAAATPTPIPVAGAVADLATAAIRFAPIVGAGESTIGATAQVAGKGVNAVEGERMQLAAGARTAQGGATNQAPLVTAVREGLMSGVGSPKDQQMMQQLSGASTGTIASAVQSLTQAESLQLAGRMLALGQGAEQRLDPAQLALMRGTTHAALADLGRALTAQSADDAALRTALAHVAAHDARPAVAQQAQGLLHAMDGQQVLSNPRMGADPGYVWFQVPLPDQRSAEVLVRRDAGRRQVSFEEFDIAFLLDTANLGTMMVHLDAHPLGVRANIKTDRPELQHVLAEQADLLIEPLRAQANRPVVVTTGVFDTATGTPDSLLTPSLGLIPGVNEFYA